MNPPLRFFVYQNYDGDNCLYKPDAIAGAYNDDDENGYRTFVHAEGDGNTFRSNQFGQSAGMNDAKGNELFAGAVTIQTSEPHPSAVVKFIEGEFVFVYKIGTQVMKCSVSALNKSMILVGHQWMDQAELKQRIAQAKRKWGSK